MFPGQQDPVEVSEPEPRRKRVPKCPEGRHTDRLVRGGKRCQCTVCGDSFPCRFECSHYNCMAATGRPLPEEAAQTAESYNADTAAYFEGLK